MQTITTSNLRKYQTSNPVVQWLIQRFLNQLLREVSVIQPKTIVDLGCGEGIVASAILKETEHVIYRGYDINPSAILEAQTNVLPCFQPAVWCDNNPAPIPEAQRRNPTADFECADIFELQPCAQSGDLLLCLEVLEHIENTDKFLKHISGLGANHFILSVPWEPFFRLGNLCRGSHVKRFGNHPEHIHCFSPMSFKRALSEHFTDVRIERSFPWLFGICQK